MTIAELVADVKRKFRIIGTALDSDVTAAVESSVPLLAPYVKAPVVDETLTIGADTEKINLPTNRAGADVRAVDLKDPSAGVYRPFTDYYKDGDTIFFQDFVTTGTQVRLYLRAPFTVATITQLPEIYRRPLVELACADFASMLAGNKSRYSIYAQTNGARSVDNMLDMADWYEARAEQRLVKMGGGEALS